MTHFVSIRNRSPDIRSVTAL